MGAVVNGILLNAATETGMQCWCPFYPKQKPGLEALHEEQVDAKTGSLRPEVSFTPPMRSFQNYAFAVHGAALWNTFPAGIATALTQTLLPLETNKMCKADSMLLYVNRLIAWVGLDRGAGKEDAEKEGDWEKHEENARFIGSTTPLSLHLPSEEPIKISRPFHHSGMKKREEMEVALFPF